MLLRWRFWLSLLVAAVILGLPIAHFRATYAHAKRLREVTPGRFYRSGQLTASGFRETVKRFGIRTVINLQEENQDPFMPEAWLGKPSIKQSEVCKELGVKYVFVEAGALLPDGVPGRPESVAHFVSLLQDESNYPILLHCKAGLHRTGLLTAIYRMECENWTEASAIREMMANGFGDFACNSENKYVAQYVQGYGEEKAKRARATGGKTR